MKYRNAVKLHNGDEVTIGRGKDSFQATVKNVKNYQEDKVCEFDVLCGSTWHRSV
jgi:hypothetical protein